MKQLFLTFFILISAWQVGAQSIVDYHGRLQAANDGSVHFLGAKSGEIAYPAGASFFWSEASSQWYTAQTVKNLHEQYNVQIVRAAMQVDPEWGGGYRPNPAFNKALVETIVQAAIDEGIYVIIDWHVEGTAWGDESIAQTFFAEMAQAYGHYDNVIYELWNEPTTQNWNSDIKPYCELIINTIRQYDPDNLILCGTQTWSQVVEDAAANPINDPNVGYVLHFYSDLHNGSLYNGKESLGVPVFVTEWGTPGYHPNTDGFRQWMENNKIPNCSWAVNNKDEPLSYFKPAVTNYTGPWAPGDLRDAGTVLTGITQNWPGNSFTPVVCTDHALPGIIQAEDFCTQSGIQTETTTDTGGGQNVGYFDAGDWVKYKVASSQSGNHELTLRIATTAAGRQVVLETPNGNTTINLPQTSTDPSNWQVWQEVTATVSLPSGNYEIALSSPTGGFNVNWFNLAAGCQGTTLTTVAIAPDNPTILVGESIQLTAQGYDECGNPMASNPTWSGNAPNGLFTASSAGSFAVTATDGAVSDQVTVTVNDGSNMLTNGNFSNGATGWESYVNGAANASPGVAGGEMHASITSGGSANWHVQWYQTGVNMQNGVDYTLTFKARAASNRTIGASVEMSNSPYTGYFNQSVSLTTQMQTFSYDFTMTAATDANARVLFNLGASNGDVYIDDVVLVENGSNPPPFSVQLEAENYSFMSGIQTEPCSEGGLNVGYIDAGDWLSFHDVNIPATGIYTVSYRVASLNGGGTISLEQNNGATVLGTINVTSTSGWQNWTTISHTVTLSAGVQNFGIGIPAGGWNLNWFRITSGSSGSRTDHSAARPVIPKLSIYPNPASDYLHFKGLEGFDHLEIIGLDGKRQLSTTIDKDQTLAVSVSQLKKGVYLIRLSGAGGTQVKRFIKR
ncbi:carbohydrate-binding protein [Marinoscillum sp.]|uniref:carbohydrate-binding protein n=1 Tax=Marinoscillum sp. TaxID=2024838 RepID=UPI003BAD321E